MASKSLKAAPRREVLEVVKVGDWGEVIYQHRLSCGHTEARKRQSPASHIACSGCVIAREFERNGPPAVRQVPVAEPIDDGVVVDDIGSIEIEVQRITAALAKRFQVTSEAIDVAISAQNGTPEVGYVVVFLDAETAKRLTNEVS